MKIPYSYLIPYPTAARPMVAMESRKHADWWHKMRAGRSGGKELRWEERERGKEGRRKEGRRREGEREGREGTEGGERVGREERGLRMHT